jgi:hypothetical protein
MSEDFSLRESMLKRDTEKSYSADKGISDRALSELIDSLAETAVTEDGSFSLSDAYNIGDRYGWSSLALGERIIQWVEQGKLEKVPVNGKFLRDVRARFRKKAN